MQEEQMDSTKGAHHVHTDGLTHSPAVRDGSSELSDGFSIVKTDRLASSEKLPRICVLIKSLGRASSSSEAPQSIVMDPNQEVQQILMGALPDIVVFYRTLVADGGLPPGWSPRHNGKTGESVSLASWEASILLKEYKAQEKKREKETKTSADQFLLARENAAFTRARQPERTPKKRKGPVGEEVLGAMLVHTPASMGQMLCDKPGTLQLPGWSAGIYVAFKSSCSSTILGLARAQSRHWLSY